MVAVGGGRSMTDRSKVTLRYRARAGWERGAREGGCVYVLSSCVYDATCFQSSSHCSFVVRLG